jgi:hypothetical protein
MNRPIPSAISLVASVFAFGCGAPNSSDVASASRTSTSPTERRTTHVETHPSQGAQRTIAGAEASLASIGDAVEARVTTTGLTPSHVYTLWFVAINDPEQCATTPCKAPDVLRRTERVKADVRWAAGGVADDAGALTLVGRVPTGPWSRGWFGNGLTNPGGAEIHLVVNDHGPALPGREQAMKTSYREGCTDESLPGPFPLSAKRDGTAGPNKCALVQDAIFVPKG